MAFTVLVARPPNGNINGAGDARPPSNEDEKTEYLFIYAHMHVP